jgi:energy-coupling factor transporter transmembrane protein EcfT
VIGMAELHHVDRTRISVLKVFYLLAVAAIAFVVPAFASTRPLQWIIIPTLLAIQVLILLACRIVAFEIARPVWRLKWLFVFLLTAYAFLPAETKSDTLLTWRLSDGWMFSINITGVEHAALMCIQIVTVVLASALVRLTGSGNDLVEGLHAFRLPPLFVHSLDQTLELLGSVRRSGGGGGKGGGGGRDGMGDGLTDEPKERDRTHHVHHLGFFAVFKRLVRGDVGALVQVVQANVRIATEHTVREGNHHLSVRKAHDVAIVTGIALCMTSLKMFKVLPGIPFASGHKGFLLVPLYILASRLTHSRWGGTTAGMIMGVISCFQEGGRFGLLQIFKSVAPGVIIDLADPLMRRLPQSALIYCFLGVVAAAASTIQEFILVLLLGARAEIYVFPAVRLLPNLLAGFLSGFVTIFLLRAFRAVSPAIDDEVNAQTRPAAGGSTGEFLRPKSGIERTKMKLPGGPTDL